MEKLQLYVYFACAVAGVVINWIELGQKSPDRPSGIKWLGKNWLYALSSLGLSLACALVFIPEQLGVNANVAALAFGLSGGTAIQRLINSARQ